MTPFSNQEKELRLPIVLEYSETKLFTAIFQKFLYHPYDNTFPPVMKVRVVEFPQFFAYRKNFCATRVSERKFHTRIGFGTDLGTFGSLIALIFGYI